MQLYWNVSRFCGVLTREALPLSPQLFLLKSLKVLWYIKATSTTDFISLRSGISMNQLTVMAL